MYTVINKTSLHITSIYTTSLYSTTLPNCRCGVRTLPSVRVNIANTSGVNILGCSAVQCSAVQCSIFQYSTVQCSAVQCSAVQWKAVQCSPVRCIAAVKCTVQFKVQWSAAWCSAVETRSLPGVLFSNWVFLFVTQGESAGCFFKIYYGENKKVHSIPLLNR